MCGLFLISFFSSQFPLSDRSQSHKAFIDELRRTDKSAVRKGAKLFQYCNCEQTGRNVQKHRVGLTTDRYRKMHVQIYNPDNREIRGAVPYNSHLYITESDI